uniref:F-box/LRR-repeat protein 5 n=1 Tax=Magallana gigas TaxID=29159 RepID=K1R0L1_MAGGI
MALNCPEEVDVFKVPHSRMKELVDRYLAMVTDTNFANVHHMTNLLENLVDAFQEFRAHEQIENKYIMKKLKAKLNALSIRSSAVCNCHSDNRLTEMLRLLQDGYQCRDKSEVDRENYGIKLRSALEDFTRKFIPHMEEEEEVFQPMLMKYFTFEELRSLKSKVIRKHQQTIEEKFDENEECVSSSSDEDEKCLRESRREPRGIELLPDEVMLNIFSYLNPKELCSIAQVSKRWNAIAMDGSNWKIIRPVQWFRGVWSCQDRMDVDQEEASLEQAEFYPLDVKFDEDADVDESEESDDIDEMSQQWKLVQRESRLLTSMVKYLFPRVGASVSELHLGYSRGLSNGVLYRMLSCCPNLEVLDLTQTRVSDIGFKSMGKNKCGRRLKHVNLSGCVNITDVTLQRISLALGSLTESKTTPQNKDSDNTASMPISEARGCCQQGMCRSQQERRIGGLDFDSVDQTLRNACDVVEREMMAYRLMEILEGEKRSPRQRTIPSLERVSGGDPHRTSSCGGRSVVHEVCDKSDNDTPQRALTFLSLSGCSLVTDEGLRFLAGEGGLPHLEHLDLSGCMQVTAAGLTELVSACGSLDHAHLFYCDNMVDDPYAVTASGWMKIDYKIAN